MVEQEAWHAGIDAGRDITAEAYKRVLTLIAGKGDVEWRNLDNVWLNINKRTAIKYLAQGELPYNFRASL